MADWPPTLANLKLDKGIEPDDTRDDETLQAMLTAVVAFVQRVRPTYNYRREPLSPWPEVPADLHAGALRLAARWHDRRRSPDGLVSWTESGGANQVPYIDPDIERMIGIGRYRGPVTA